MIYVATLDTTESPAVVTFLQNLPDGTDLTQLTPPLVPPTYVQVPAAVAEPTALFMLGWRYDGTNWLPPLAEVNQQALLTKAANALAANHAYLAIPAPTQAQAVAQVAALTRQTNALIRLAAGQLSDTSDT